MLIVKLIVQLFIYPCDSPVSPVFMICSKSFDFPSWTKKLIFKLYCDMKSYIIL